MSELTRKQIEQILRDYPPAGAVQHAYQLGMTASNTNAPLSVEDDLHEIGAAFMEKLPPDYVWNDSPTEYVTELENRVFDLEAVICQRFEGFARRPTMKAIAEMTNEERLAVEVMGANYNPSQDLYWWGEDSFVYKKDWHPFTNIEQAFMLVEKMMSNGWRFSLSSFQESNFFWCGLSHDKPILMRDASGSTPSKAICNAIIKTLEG